MWASSPPLLLNYVVLKPGEALYVAPGELHAYLKGESLELMANSDNVIRGALTNKHIDIPELISVLTFDSEKALPFRAAPKAAGDEEEFFPLLAPDFRLSRISRISGCLSRVPTGPEILLCAEGRLCVKNSGEGDSGGPETVEIGRGEAAFVRADSGEYQLSGDGVVYRAFVPEEGSAR